jgi:hypothetical protein
LKFAPLLAQFLYTHKRLDLPGIGSFLLDASSNIDAEQVKQGKPVLLEGVSFENNSGVKQSPELISFIAAQSGKIKALASADLDSHLELAKQFLNIGKPFLFEGIGSISKLQAGGFSFTPGFLILDKLKESAAKETASGVSSEEPVSDYRSIFYSKKAKTNWKKPLVAFLLLAGIILAIWGGYAVYKKTTAKKTAEPLAEETNTELVKDTTTNVLPEDTTGPATSVAPPTVPVVIPTGNYKFIVETAARDRALKRFSKLKNMGLAIQMETSDSATFKLYFIIPAAIADTAHIVDSLRSTYTPAGNRAYVEQ